MAYAQLFGLDASAVTESNFETVFGNLLEGVFLGIDNECRVSASAVPGASVEVDTGVFITGGVFGRVSVSETVAVPAAAGGNVRCDRIALQRDNTTNALTVVRVIGAEVAAPGPPVCPALVRVGGIYQISLARVYVDAAGVVAENDVTDERAEPALCGYVSGKAYEQVARGHVEGNRQVGAWSGYGSATLLALSGLYGISDIIDNASAAVQDADGVGLRQDTSAVINNRAYTLGAWNTAGPVTAPCHARRYWSVFECKFKLGATITNIRLMVGLHSSPTPANVFVDAGGAFDYALLRFSTAVDTNFQFVYRNNGGAQQVVDTNILPVLSTAYIFRVTCFSNETHMLLELLDTSRNVLASLWITGATIPALAVNMYPWSGIETLGAAVRSIIQYYANGVNRKT